jgi:predicted methyltransferase
MVLQHITDDADYAHWCRELFECLNPGGQLLVIDHLQQGGMEAHMRPRGMKAIKSKAAWADMVQLGEHHSHWIGLFLKP